MTNASKALFILALTVGLGAGVVAPIFTGDPRFIAVGVCGALVLLFASAACTPLKGSTDAD